jgi:hypothetical protein
LNYRTVFDACFALYVAALFAPVVGEFAGIEAYAVVLAGAWVIVYAGIRVSGANTEGLPVRLGRRPTATVVIVLPFVYGVAYILGSFVAEPPVQSPYVYLGLWDFVVGILTVAVARETAGVGRDRTAPTP